MQRKIVCQIFVVIILLFSNHLFAHPMPNSVVNLSVLKSTIEGEAKIPLYELENALGMPADNNLPVNNTFFQTYFLQHIGATSNRLKWNTIIHDIHTIDDMDSSIGQYREVIVGFEMEPKNLADLRSFTFDYDAVVHQVVTHKILVFVKDDWRNGVHQQDNNSERVGVIKTNFKIGKRLPLQITLASGSWWKGLQSMIALGLQHIEEGTDHLLFILVLLLPGMLLVEHGRWAHYGGIKYSLRRLVKIITAFTIGHSVTLLLGALDVFHLPSQPIEVTIAVSILISAIHALRPLFYNREIYIAGGFGLIHGMAFASVLSNMKLGAATLLLSILGFNAGIELMQLFIVTLVIPWLVLLSQTRWYSVFRVTGALFAAMASFGWIAERCSGEPNILTEAIVNVYSHAIWFVPALAVMSVVVFAIDRYIQTKSVIRSKANKMFFKPVNV